MRFIVDVQPFGILVTASYGTNRNGDCLGKVQHVRVSSYAEVCWLALGMSLKRR